MQKKYIPKFKSPCSGPGAPTKEINWDMVDQMLISGSSGPQCASAIGVHPDTLYIRCENEKNMLFSQYRQQKVAHGDSLLHAAQFNKAIADQNPTMLIWLGKQRLGQKESHDNNPANDEKLSDALSVIKSFDFESLRKSLEEKEKEIQELKEKLGVSFKDESKS